MCFVVCEFDSLSVVCSLRFGDAFGTALYRYEILCGSILGGWNGLVFATGYGSFIMFNFLFYTSTIV